MTNKEKEQRERVRLGIQTTRKILQRLVDGHSDATSLGDLRERADWELCWLLCDVIPVLPNDVRAEVQACYDLNRRIWSKEYLDQYYAQQKTSPECLAATDSL